MITDICGDILTKVSADDKLHYWHKVDEDCFRVIFFTKESAEKKLQEVQNGRV